MQGVTSRSDVSAVPGDMQSYFRGIILHMISPVLSKHIIVLAQPRSACCRLSPGRPSPSKWTFMRMWQL